MELLYIWDYTDYDEIKEYLLSSKYEICFCEKSKELSIVKREDYINGFWADNVSDVIAVVGDNGTGKTMMLKTIMNVLALLQGESKSPEYFIAVFEDEKNVVKVYTTMEHIYIKADDIKTVLNSFEGQTVDELHTTKTIYFSNMLSLYDYKTEQGTYVENVSIGGQMRDDANYMRYIRDENVIEDVLANYYQIEQQRILEFLYCNINQSNLSLPFAKPSCIGVRLIDNIMEIEDIQDAIEDILKNSERKRAALENFDFHLFLESMVGKNEDHSEGELLTDLIINLYYEIQTTRLMEKLQDQERIDRGNRIFCFVKTCLEYNPSIEHRTIYEAVKTFIIQLRENLIGFSEYTPVCEKYLTFIEWLRDEADFFVRLDSKHITLAKTEKFEKRIKEFLDLYSSTSEFFPYITFDFGLSAGEYNFLDMFVNIYAVVSRLENNAMSKWESMLLLFDEMELSMHVKWQQKYLEWILQFVSSTFKKCDVKIIFTTHSPIILSDIPKNNVVYLEKGKDINSVNCRREVNTFGNNIHTLFLDSFFLDDTGTIGAFAERKINEVAAKLLKDETLEDEHEIRTIINYIGDDIIRNKLIQLYERKTSNKIVKRNKIENSTAIDTTISLLEKQKEQIEEAIRELKRQRI